jgi:hypothetical protein
MDHVVKGRRCRAHGRKRELAAGGVRSSWVTAWGRVGTPLLDPAVGSNRPCQALCPGVVDRGPVFPGWRRLVYS